MSYCIITPVKNEDEYIERTILSLLSQTLKPKEWIIVNDGSTDNTHDIVKKFSAENRWIKLISRENSGRPFGSNVVDAFYCGYNVLSSKHEFIVKLDGDIEFDSICYFEKLIDRFNQNPNLGLAGGYLYKEVNGRKIYYEKEKWRVSGAIKMYRWGSFEKIGGLERIYGWDGLDEYKLMYNGLETQTFFDLKVNHLGYKKETRRKRSDTYYSNRARSYYKRGYNLIFMLVKVFLILISTRKLKNAVTFLREYIDLWINHEPKVVSKNEARFINNFQLIRLLKYR